MQIWHGGRAVHPCHIGGQQTWGPSPIAIKGSVLTNNGLERHRAPKEMSKEDIKEVIREFRVGAQNAKEAGFDGLELHAADGYLIDSFLRNGSNKR